MKTNMSIKEKMYCKNNYTEKERKKPPHNNSVLTVDADCMFCMVLKRFFYVG